MDEPFAASPAPEPAKTFALDFGPPVHGRVNADLDRRGTLVVRTAEPAFLFTGHARRTLGFGREAIEFALRRDEVRNVRRHGAAVVFDTTAGKSGAKRSPFHFTAVSEAEAAAIVDLLPTTQDNEFAASGQFRHRLQSLPDARSGLGSITHLILIVNAVVFVVMGLLGAGWFEVASMTPYIRFAANNGAATTDGEWWRLITCVFVHYGLVHLLLNAWALFQSGPLVERLFGRPLYAVIYLGSGLLGGFATLFWKGDRVWSAGASGAVFGVYGALIGYLWRAKKDVPAGVFRPMLTSALVFAGYNLLYGAANPRIDNAAHLGGLIAGVGLGACCVLPLDREQRARLRPSRLRLALGIVVGGVALGVIFVPRFDYRVRDEFAWRDLVQPFVDREREMVKKEQAVLSGKTLAQQTAMLTTWLNAEGVPFYADWKTKIDAMSLAPQRATARRRDRLGQLLDLKLAAYRRFLGSVDGGPEAAFARFRLDQKEIADAAKAFAATK